MAVAALAGEGLVPVKTPSGKAGATIIYNKIIRSVVPQPYNEIIFSLDAMPAYGAALADATPMCKCCSPWDMAYDAFRTVPGHRHFLHTLYVDSAFAAESSRQTQGIPKHPLLPKFTFTANNYEISLALSLQGQPLFTTYIPHDWPSCMGLCGDGGTGPGCCMLNRLALGFCGAFGLCKLLGLLTSAQRALSRHRAQGCR